MSIVHTIMLTRRIVNGMQICRKVNLRMFHTSEPNYAKKIDAVGGIASLGKKKGKLGKLGPMMEKKIMPVETDPHKLVNYVCGTNLYKEGEDVKIKPDSEYPDWLWSLHTGPAPSLEELDPESKEYWIKVRTIAMRRNNRLAKGKKF